MDSNGTKSQGYIRRCQRIQQLSKNFEQDIYIKYQEFTHQANKIKAEDFKTLLIGTPQKFKSLLVIFHEHNDRIKVLVGQEYAKGTLERYKTSLKHTQDFLNWNTKRRI